MYFPLMQRGHRCFTTAKYTCSLDTLFHYTSSIQSCKTLKQVHQIQAQVITHGLAQNDYLVEKVITGSALFKEIDYANKVFDEIPDPNVVLWNALLSGYCRNELYRDVMGLFCQMRNGNIMPNCYTFPIVLKSSGKSGVLMDGFEVQCLVIKGGFGANRYVGSVLIEMYSGWREIDLAYKVFGEMVERNVVAWTSMINGYISIGDIVSARKLFDLAPERDVVLWNTMVSAYIQLGHMVDARKLFDKMPNRDVMSWNTILAGYAQNGDIDACEKLFEEMSERNVFSWNVLIGGYARNGQLSQVLDTFKRMLIEKTVCPNDATLVTVLSACSRLGALDLSEWIHIYSENLGYKENIYVRNALIDMYAKCGNVKNALDVFMNMKEKDLISWNSIINGLATHGCGADSLNLFDKMKIAKVKPDAITFIGVLCACTHMGLVEDGFSYFRSMVDEYAIDPQIEHYGCIVDLLGRAGLLAQAIEFVRNMPMKPDAVIWTALLGACRIHKNVEVAELALRQLNEFEPNNPANYVVLSNIYGDLRRWKEVAQLKAAMKDTGFRKLPGCSLIEVNDGVVEFYSFDERHPKKEEIYDTLRGLFRLLKSSGYIPDLMEVDEDN